MAANERSAPNSIGGAQGSIVAIYQYSQSQRVVRFQPKTFRPQYRSVGGEWMTGKGSHPWPLYREAALAEHREGDVHITEGEKDADTLSELGLLAVSPGSSSTPWRPEWTALLSNRTVVIHGENDLAGKRRASQLAGLLSPGCARVTVVEYPDLPEHGDVTDYLATHILPELLSRIASTPESTATADVAILPIHAAPLSPPWPVLDPAARHGFAGEVLDTIEAHTEADPAALLITYLTFFGCALGRNPHMLVSGDRHGTNLFSVIVGDTAKARKGTSRAFPAAIMARADPDFARCVAGGLVSGEGVVWAIRDPITKVKGGSEVIEDEGIADKRLLVLEEEFSSVIKVASRYGNTSSETLRRAWDSRSMTSLAKNSPGRCDEPHVALIGHITKVELNRVMADTEAANGFANRILWVAARRSRLLPEGGSLTGEAIDRLALQTQQRLESGRRLGLIKRSDPARQLWGGIYEALSRPAPGMLGAMSARSEAHVLRLSLV